MFVVDLSYRLSDKHAALEATRAQVEIDSVPEMHATIYYVTALIKCEFKKNRRTRSWDTDKTSDLFAITMGVIYQYLDEHFPDRAISERERKRIAQSVFDKQFTLGTKEFADWVIETLLETKVPVAQ